MTAKSRGAKVPSWVFPTVVVVAALILILVIVLQNRPSSPTGGPGDTGTSSSEPPLTAPTEIQGPQQINLSQAETRSETDLLAVGPVDAPVVMVVFSDYQCPFCARWSADTLPLMMDEVEAGNLRIEWRQVNVFGPASERAARAEYAAALQDRLVDYQEKLFPDGSIRSEAQLSEEALVSLAADLGLDRDKFAADLNSPETVAVVADNATFGLDLGAYSTPVFVIGGQPLVGAQPTAVFVDTFNAALEMAK